MHKTQKVKENNQLRAAKLADLYKLARKARRFFEPCDSINHVDHFCLEVQRHGADRQHFLQLTRAMPATQKECSRAKTQEAQRKQRVMPASPGKKLFPHVLCEPLRTLREAKKELKSCQIFLFFMTGSHG